MSTVVRAHLGDFLAERIGVGLFAVDAARRVHYWNHFMAAHSGRPSEEVVGRNLYEVFPDLPREWLERKLRTVWVLGTHAFSSWEQRPYLFEFSHNRAMTAEIDHMLQDLTFMPVRDGGEVSLVCVAVHDVTDTGLYETRLAAAMRRLEKLSHQDGLTGVGNRAYFELRLAEEFGRARRYGGELSLLMFDLDRFKAVNDRHGHLSGDEVLRAVAEVAARQVRGVDVVARYGGEEFAVLAPQTGLEGARVLAERMRAAVEAEHIRTAQATVRVTISVGAAVYDGSMGQARDLVLQADQALYESKRAGRNRVSVAPPSEDTPLAPPASEVA